VLPWLKVKAESRSESFEPTSDSALGIGINEASYNLLLNDKKMPVTVHSFLNSPQKKSVKISMSFREEERLHRMS
jgi:hypothetical protein